MKWITYVIIAVVGSFFYAPVERLTKKRIKNDIVRGVVRLVIMTLIYAVLFGIANLVISAFGGK